MSRLYAKRTRDGHNGGIEKEERTATPVQMRNVATALRNESRSIFLPHPQYHHGLSQHDHIAVQDSLLEHHKQSPYLTSATRAEVSQLHARAYASDAHR